MRCEAEIGKPGHWHQCKRGAVVRVTRDLGVSGIYFLHYCDRHVDRVNVKPRNALQISVQSIAR